MTISSRLDLFDHSVVSEELWVRFERRSEDRQVMLRTLAAVSAASKVTRKMLGVTVVWGVLRLAAHNVSLAR